MTDDIADSAADWIRNLLPGVPYFAYVAFIAAHRPFHCPPETADPDPYGGHVFPCTDHPEADSVEKYQSMIEALDLDFLDLLNAIKARDNNNLTNTLVIIVSDNGSDPEVAQPPFLGKPVKGTVGQGGIWVPLIIGGNGVRQGIVPKGQPVGTVDLYRTILTAAGIPDPSPDCTVFPTPDDDSCDLTPYFSNPPPVDPLRPYLYSETFYPNFDPNLSDPKPGPSIGWQAIRNWKWKYARGIATTENWLYDLENDPAGNNNLFPPLPGSPAAAALEELEQKLGQLLPGGLLSICGRSPVGQACTMPSPPISEECCSEVCAGSVSSPECRNPPWGAEPACPDVPWSE
jgi:arylsulfatase A-like enzyme